MNYKKNPLEQYGHPWIQKPQILKWSSCYGVFFKTIGKHSMCLTTYRMVSSQLHPIIIWHCIVFEWDQVTIQVLNSLAGLSASIECQQLVRSSGEIKQVQWKGLNDGSTCFEGHIWLLLKALWEEIITIIIIRARCSLPYVASLTLKAKWDNLLCAKFLRLRLFTAFLCNQTNTHLTQRNVTIVNNISDTLIWVLSKSTPSMSITTSLSFFQESLPQSYV